MVPGWTISENKESWVKSDVDIVVFFFENRLGSPNLCGDKLDIFYLIIPEEIEKLRLFLVS